MIKRLYVNFVLWMMGPAISELKIEGHQVMADTAIKGTPSKETEIPKLTNEKSRTILWRRNCAPHQQLGVSVERDPDQRDVLDGRAEYLLIGSIRLAEGEGVAIEHGRPVFWGGSRRPNQRFS